MSAGRYFVGVDVGGTFTDVVLGSADGDVHITKVATTPDDPRDGVTAGILEVLERQQVAPGDVARLVHGTTLATNVILERRGAEVAFVTTEGFVDMLRLGRESRREEERFDLFFSTPDPPVPQERVFEVHERVGPKGEIDIALDPDAVAKVAAGVAASGAEAVAVCLLHAYAHPAHEEAVAAAIRTAMGPGAYVITSSEVWPEIREYDRAITTVMCAYVGPVMHRYLAGLESRLGEMGIGCPVEIMESSGGIMSAALAARRPVFTLESGGAAGVIAAAFIGTVIGADQVLSFDMGGTTAKTGIVRGGRTDITHDFHVGGADSSHGSRHGSSFPIKIPVVDLAEVGAGGGSIASVDTGGALRVGPRSSGSVPGPACYGRGGTEPTVTDANLVLGYLRAGPLSGGVSLEPALAEQAIERAVAGPLGIDVLAAAHAIHEVANSAMASAIRMVTVQRGIDPRGFTLVAFGGAGPAHAAALADTFGIARLVVPRAAGVASALGLVASDLVVERIVTRHMAAGDAGADELAAVFSELEAQAVAELPPGDGVLSVERLVDVRYKGQAHELPVPAPPGPVGADTVAAVVAGFAVVYQATYGIVLEAPAEFVNFRVRVRREVDKPTPVAAPPTGRGTPVHPLGQRPLAFGGHLQPACAVYGWEGMVPGNEVSGPAVIEGYGTSIVVPPGFVAELDRWSNVVLTHRPAPGPAPSG